MKKYVVEVEAYGDDVLVGVRASNREEAKEKAIEFAMGNHTFTVYNTEPDYKATVMPADCVEPNIEMEDYK